jgi:predicted dehydrogenase
VPTACGSYEEVLANPSVDLVYVALPNHLHAPWTIKAIMAGKHVLCEKPFAMNAAEARVMVAAAKRKGVFLMEGFMYRCHPQMDALRALLKSRVLGDVRLIRAGFAFDGITEKNVRMGNPQGGGGLMDVGCYPVSFMRFVAGEEPVECKATAVIGKKSRVDHWAAGVLRFPSGAIGYFDCGMMVNSDWSATVFGTKGRVRLNSPWIPEDRQAEMEITMYDDWKTESRLVKGKHYFAHEAETVARCILSGKREAREMSWSDTLGNMRAIDALRSSMGLAWDQEKRSRR